jgi:hypothetical protein
MQEPSKSSNNMFLLGAVAITAALGYLAWKSSREELTRPSEPVLPPMRTTDNANSDMIIRIVDPQGRHMDVVFTADEWSMIKEIEKHSGEELGDIVIDIVAGRIRNNTLGQ